MRAFGVGLLTAVVLIVAPAAHARDVRIDWPELDQVKLGERVTVGVSSERRARASLVRLGATGKPLRPVASRSLKRGSFSAEVPRLGKYELRVVVDGKRHTRAFEVMYADCPGAPGAELTLRLAATSVRVGGTLQYEVTNTGSSCALGGDGYRFERRQADGSWAPLPPQVFTLVGRWLTPGIALRKWAAIPGDATPGRYRLIESAMVQGGEVSATAEFDVTE